MSKPKLLKFTNCRTLRNHSLVEEPVWVLNGKIKNPCELFDDDTFVEVEVNCIDLKNGVLSPGFIDLQVNGGYGIDFTHDLVRNPDGVNIVAKNLLANGVTAFCPTLVSSGPEIYHSVLPFLAPKLGGKHGATILGSHAEGPFLNLERRGVHNPELIVDLNGYPQQLINMYKHMDAIKLVTLAPEKDKSMGVIRWLANKNIVVSIGHSCADLNTAELAVKAGAKLITHLFNAMPSFHHRDPSVIGLLGSSCTPDIYYSVIADFVHVHPCALRLAFSAHPKGCVLVTDCTAATGISKGFFHLGNIKIEVRNDGSYIPNTNILAGSIAKLNECVRKFKHATCCTMEQALETVTLHPAEVLGIQNKKGNLIYESDADFVVLDDNFEVLSTWIAGECVYNRIQ